MKNITNIEIELFSYCNRQCQWCPNKNIDRTFFKELDEEIFNNLIIELKEHNYTGNIIISRYSEPLSHEKILKEKINYIKNIINNNIIINSNGDFLSNNILTNLNVNQLNIMDYNNYGREICATRILEAGAKIRDITEDCIKAEFNNIKISYYLNWTKNNFIANRANYLTEYNTQKRTQPCLEPQHYIGIEYDGSVVPCCNIRNDILEHKDYVLGNLKDNSLFNILNSKKALDFKNKCENGIFNPQSICYYCLYKN